MKSGSLSPFKRFAFELRDIIRRQPLPGYTLFLEVDGRARVLLAFEPACEQAVNPFVLSGTREHVPSRTGLSCYREPKQGLSLSTRSGNRGANLESNRESNSVERADDVHDRIRRGRKRARLMPSESQHLPSFRKDGFQAPDPLSTSAPRPSRTSGESR
ncbi:MAG TPA: replication initiator protein A [Caulobacter sp.]|nr:replication initiator protein A [Caulobacter sp.]